MIDLLRKYIDNRFQLIKLELISALANVAAGLISSFFLLAMGLIFLIMFNFALAFYLGGLFENQALGFLVVGLLYVLLFVLYYYFFKNTVDKNVKDKIVKTIFMADKEMKGAEDEDYEVYEEKTDDNY